MQSEELLWRRKPKTGGTYCSVPGCPNNFYKRPPGVTFQRIPMNENRIRWLAAIHRKEGEGVCLRHVCSEHFRVDDFWAGGNRKLLKSHAVPTVNLPESKTDSHEIQIPGNSNNKEKWLDALQMDINEPWYNYVSKRVCSEHFNHDDWYKNHARKMLKDNALPTLNLLRKKSYVRVIPQSILTGDLRQGDAAVGDVRENVVNKDNHKEWMIALGRSPDEKIAESRRVCSKHFSEKNFIVQGGKVKLKENALPDIVPKFAVPASSLASNSFGVLEHQPSVVPGPNTLVVPIQIKMDIEEASENACESFSLEDPLPVLKIEETVGDLEHLSNMQIANEESEGTSETSSTSGDSSSDPCENECKNSRHQNVPREFVEAFHSYAVSPAKLSDKLKRQESVIGRLKIKLQTMDRQYTRLKIRVDGLERTLKDLGLKKRNSKKKKNIPKDIEKILDVTHNGVPIYLVKAKRSVDEVTKNLNQEHNYVSSSDSS